MNDSPIGKSRVPKLFDAADWLAAIVESSDDAIIGKTLDGTITSWNAGAERIFGYRAEEVVGQPITILIPKDLQREEEVILERIRSGGRIDHFETTRVRKDGREVRVSLTISPIHDDQGQIAGISKIARDVTEHKRLREQEEQARAEMLMGRRFRELIENAPDAILQVDYQGIIMIANRTAELMFGYSRSELIGSKVDLLVPEASRSHHAEHRRRFGEAGVSRPMGLGLNLHALRKDGSEFPVEISLSPTQTETGACVTAVIRDVTDRKRAEQRILMLQESYMTELEAREKESERLNHLKSEFVASVSHELRTPLHTIIGFADLLGEESKGALNETQRRFLHHIQKDSRHLLELINDVLDLSRIEAGTLRLQTADVSAGGAIAEAVDAILPFAVGKGVTLSIEHGPIIHVMADPLRLRQIFYNLLSNAVKFTESGGQVIVRYERSGDFVCFSVSDTGMGIPDEEHVRIFQKFYQVGHTTVGVRQGTGLGLAICRQLVEMQGGKIWVKSQSGKGSHFFFTLPMQQP